MTATTRCKQCGEPLEPRGGRGRPRQFCTRPKRCAAIYKQEARKRRRWAWNAAHRIDHAYRLGLGPYCAYCHYLERDHGEFGECPVRPHGGGRIEDDYGDTGDTAYLAHAAGHGLRRSTHMHDKAGPTVAPLDADDAYLDGLDVDQEQVHEALRDGLAAGRTMPESIEVASEALGITREAVIGAASDLIQDVLEATVAI